MHPCARQPTQGKPSHPTYPPADAAPLAPVPQAELALLCQAAATGNLAQLEAAIGPHLAPSDFVSAMSSAVVHRQAAAAARLLHHTHSLPRYGDGQTGSLRSPDDTLAQAVRLFTGSWGAWAADELQYAQLKGWQQTAAAMLEVGVQAAVVPPPPSPTALQPLLQDTPKVRVAWELPRPAAPYASPLHQALCTEGLRAHDLLPLVRPEHAAAADQHGRTPLHYVAHHHCELDSGTRAAVARALVAAGASLTALDAAGMTPLMCSVYSASDGDRLNAMALVRALTSPESAALACGPAHQTPMQFAVSRCEGSALAAMAQCGACDAASMTAVLQWAVDTHNHEALAVLRLGGAVPPASMSLGTPPDIRRALLKGHAFLLLRWGAGFMPHVRLRLAMQLGLTALAVAANDPDMEEHDSCGITPGRCAPTLQQLRTFLLCRHRQRTAPQPSRRLAVLPPDVLDKIYVPILLESFGFPCT